MKNLILSSALALITVPAGYAQEAVQWRVEDGGNGHWYALTAVQGTWPAVRADCESRGGHLVTITSAPENAFASPLAGAGSTTAWIGAFQPAGTCEPLCDWRWVTGEPWDYAEWAPPGANDFGSGEDCAETYNSGGWNDMPTTGWTRRGIIEWSADCNGDGIVDFGQIRSGILVDDNLNNVPDCCELGTSCTPCPGDITKGGSVDATDLSIILAAWGSNGQGEFQADIDGSGLVDGGDLALVLGGWGPCNAPAWATVISWMPDSSIVTDPQLRASITATGQPWRVRDTATGIEMLLVPPGSFQMGCLVGSDAYACTNGELPVHQVTLTQAFYLGRFEVTQAQWQTSMGSNPSFFQGHSDSNIRPVEQVSWDSIQSFVSATGLRLPSEAEWEFACRAGTPTPFYNGSTDDSSVGSIAWYGLNSNSQTHAVGGKAANGLGFHDMLGNVWEWVNDGYSEYTASAQTNPAGQRDAEYRVVRGGSWLIGTNEVRSSYRLYNLPGSTYSSFGFRIARNP